MKGKNGSSSLRILLVSDHKYPASGSRSIGLRSRTRPSGSGQHIHDLLTRGLAELGHEVFYRLHGGAAEPLPPPITAVSGTIPPVDIVHVVNPYFLRAEDVFQDAPWVATCHMGKNFHDTQYATASHKTSFHNWIFVSQTQATSYGSNRFVYNGIDPESYRYSEKKDDYFLFISAMNNYKEKGLLRALNLSQQMHFNLVVAGTSSDRKIIQKVSELCHKVGAKYVGDVRGEEKADLFAHAKAMIFPTELDECCPLVIAESLISGTPVIVSNISACAEMICPEVGSVCMNEQDYINAVSDSSSISPHRCRDYAMEKFHYRRMVKNYVKEYLKEITT